MIQNKDDRSNEKLSVKIVFLITLLGCLLPLSSWGPNQDFLHSVSPYFLTLAPFLKQFLKFIPLVLLLFQLWQRKQDVYFPRSFFHYSILFLCGFYHVAFLWWVWKRWRACTNKIEEAYSWHFQRSPFLLLPWIFVSCVLGMVAEMFLFWAAGRLAFIGAHLVFGAFFGEIVFIVAFHPFVLLHWEV